MTATGEHSSPGQHTFSAAPDGGTNNSPGQQATVHKRTYQACLPCRKRKVRCDLGSVDAPGDPPCQRCRREKKDCTFSETRRKRKTDEEGGELSDEYIARNRRSSAYMGQNDGLAPGQALPGFQRPAFSSLPLDTQATQTSPFPGKRSDKAASNRDVANEHAAELFQRPIIQPQDALNMLVDAASRTEIEESNRGSSIKDRDKLLAKQAHRLSTSGQQRPDQLSSAIDPNLMDIQDSNHHSSAEADLAAALEAWSTLRFVRAGWFTAREAIAYINFFYEKLAPLTPVSPPDFSDYAEHPRLLNEEPMLTVTLLTITSRYKILDGPGGATRSFKIHDKLWEYLQNMVTKMFWGQEQFGGGFCGAGTTKTLGGLEAKRRGLRSLGTAESLLLLSDWLPRSMHFNPADDAGELLVVNTGSAEETDGNQALSNIHAAWMEPAIRSDRMCWSLVGMAYTLSWELGVFDSLLETGVWSPGPQAKTAYDGERADRIGRMLLVYVSQACGRLGYPNMMPSQGNETNFNFLKMDIPEGRYPGPYGTITETDKIQRAWAELTALMRQSNTEMFESKTRVNEVIKNGTYMKFLEYWGPRMKEWKEKFDLVEMPKKANMILRMEFEYTKTYIYSVSLQAVVESCAAPTNDSDEGKATNAHTPPALFSSKVVDVHKQNRSYIEELIEAARNVLRIAVEELYPSGGLRHAPVRTHFRVLSGAMFLLKSFAVGGKEADVAISLGLLDKTVNALRHCVIDDVHLSLRIADLLNGLTMKIRQKFVRLAVKHPGSKNRSSHTHRTSTSNPTSAPKAESGGERRQPANNAVPNSSSTHGAGSSTVQTSSATPSGTFVGNENWYSSLGLDEAPPLVNLKDSNITVMPPPDYNDFSNPPNPAPISPHSSNAAIGSPTIGNIGGNRPRNSSFESGQMPFSPSHTSFSPMSSGSGKDGYDWLALDFNPLLSNGVSFGPGDHQGHHSAQGNPSSGGHMHEGGNGAIHDGQGHDGQAFAAPSPWTGGTGGAFGPEISEGLDMLSALGALVWEDPNQQGENPAGHGW